MASFTPPVETTGPVAPDAQAGSQPAPTALPEKPSTPPQGVSADRSMGQPAQQPQAQEQPQEQVLAGKFRGPEAVKQLEKAYLELQQKLGQQGQQKAQHQEQPQEQKADQPKGGFDMSPFRAEYMRDGKLSEASYEALQKMGFSRADVDQYIAGAEAMAQRAVAEITAPVGGMEGYQQMIAWAAQNLSAPEIMSFNEAVQSDNVAIAKMAVEALAAKWQAAEGKAPNLIHGTAARGGGYQSMAEFKRDLNDPRYLAGDTAFHAEVRRKLENTTAF